MQSGSGHPPLERDVSLGETNVTRGGHPGRHSLLRSPTGVPSSRCAGQKGSRHIPLDCVFNGYSIFALAKKLIKGL